MRMHMTVSQLLTIWGAALSVAGCGSYQPTAAVLRDPGEQIGSSWNLCAGQKPEDAVHDSKLTARLSARLPMGSPEGMVRRFLTEEGFELRKCDENPAIHTARYSWDGGWDLHGLTYGGLGLITYKVDKSGRLLWVTGFVQYGGP